MLIASAYYHRAERSYAFWFPNEKKLQEFLDADLNDDGTGHELHGDWTIEYVNPPSLYGTGDEIATW